MRYGLERLAQDAAACGIDGCLLIDACVEEAHDYVGAMHQPRARHRLPGRAHQHGAAAETGGAILHRLRLPGFAHRRDRRARFALGAVAPLVRAMRAVTDLPLAVGFGISKPEHVAELGGQVEAVVVGSAIRAPDRDGMPTTRRSKFSSNRSTRELKHGFGAARMTAG